LEEIQAAKDFTVKKLFESYPKTIDRRRNQILVAIGSVVTLLVSIKDFSQIALFNDWLLIIVIVSLSSGVATIIQIRFFTMRPILP